MPSTSLAVAEAIKLWPILPLALIVLASGAIKLIVMVGFIEVSIALYSDTPKVFSPLPFVLVFGLPVAGDFSLFDAVKQVD